jgi:hypothetical protein
MYFTLSRINLLKNVFSRERQSLKSLGFKLVEVLNLNFDNIFRCKLMKYGIKIIGYHIPQNGDCKHPIHFEI